jgi:hypothetical protein
MTSEPTRLKIICFGANIAYLFTKIRAPSIPFHTTFIFNTEYSKNVVSCDIGSKAFSMMCNEKEQFRQILNNLPNLETLQINSSPRNLSFLFETVQNLPHLKNLVLSGKHLDMTGIEKCQHLKSLTIESKKIDNLILLDQMSMSVRIIDS